MAGRGAGPLGQIHRLWDLGTFAGLTGAQLLARFGAGPEDGAELAFETLLERHGPMVFRVCRGVLRDEHAAEASSSPPSSRPRGRRSRRL
jgi:HlyD family secretion protein